MIPNEKELIALERRMDRLEYLACPGPQRRDGSDGWRAPQDFYEESLDIYTEINRTLGRAVRSVCVVKLKPIPRTDPRLRRQLAQRKKVKQFFFPSSGAALRMWLPSTEKWQWEWLGGMSNSVKLQRSMVCSRCTDGGTEIGALFQGVVVIWDRPGCYRIVKRGKAYELTAFKREVNKAITRKTLKNISARIDAWEKRGRAIEKTRVGRRAPK